jgi:adenylate kinase
MQDDFDSGMGIPDDELAGESATSEGDALGGHDDIELEAPDGEPVGRASGGARAMSSGGAGKAAPRKAAPAKKAAKAAKKAVKKAKPARKAAKASKKSAPKKKSAKKSARKAAPKKKAAKRKAGKKK